MYWKHKDLGDKGYICIALNQIRVGGGGQGNFDNIQIKADYYLDGFPK